MVFLIGFGEANLRIIFSNIEFKIINIRFVKIMYLFYYFLFFRCFMKSFDYLVKEILLFYSLFIIY
jgi:hypothetical protein